MQTYLLKKLSNEILQNTIDFYKNINTVPFSKNEIIKTTNHILCLLQQDSFNQKDYSDIPIHSLNIFHLICEYKLAYESSKEEIPDSLLLLSKGKKYRIKRFSNNEAIINDENIEGGKKLIPYFENVILDLLLKEETEKFGYLALGYAYFYKEVIYKQLKILGAFDKKFITTIDEFYKAIDFFSYTYLAPSKIVNSLSILLYKKIKSIDYLSSGDEITIHKFIQNISNICFNKDAIEIRKEYYEREIYIAGIYNQSIIFQWNTSTKEKEYYTEENLQQLLDYLKPLMDEKSIVNMYWMQYVEKTHKQKFNFSKLDIPTLKSIIENFPLTYSIRPPKLINNLPLPPKPLKYYVFYPIYFIATKFVALLTKFETQRYSQ